MEVMTGPDFCIVRAEAFMIFYNQLWHNVKF